MRELARARRAYAPQLIAIQLLMLAHIALDMWMPFLTAGVIDRVIIGREFSMLPFFLWSMAACAVGGPTLNALSVIVNASASQGMLRTLRGQLFDRFLALPLDFVARHGRGRMLSRYIHDVEQINGAMIDLPIAAIGLTEYLLATLFIVAWFNWRLAAAALILSPPLAVLVSRMNAASGKTIGRVSDHKAAVSQTAAVTLSAMRLIRQADRQSLFRARFAARNAENAAAEVANEDVKNTYQPLIDFLCNLTVLSMTVVGTLMVFRGQLSVGKMTSAGWYIFMYVSSVMGIGGVIRGYASHRESRKKLDPLVIDDAPAAGGRTLAHCAGGIRFDGLCAGYDGMVVTGVSAEIPPGAIVQLVGGPGAGKTTLALALARIVKTEGALFIDGVDASEYALDSLRAAVNYVFEEPFVFTGTVRENICFANPGATDAQICDAVRDSALEEFVAGLPRGLDTTIRQTSVSGGQRARLCLARALLADAPILVLDGVMSALDIATARHVLDNLIRRRRGRTTLVITQTPLKGDVCDLTLVMDGGRLVQWGPTDALAAEDGPFRRMLAAFEDQIWEVRADAEA
jgi:ABC-type multidrug transport system fused ATPase/permease subunit